MMNDDDEKSDQELVCLWWTKYNTVLGAKQCYGKVTIYEHRHQGEVPLCNRHVCKAKEDGCRFICRDKGYQCGSCCRTAEGKARRRQYDNQRNTNKRWKKRLNNE